jgi:hypothetical protein
VESKQREALLKFLIRRGFVKMHCDAVDQGESACAAAAESSLDILRTIDIKDLPDQIKGLLTAIPSSKGL